jgi:hypothetical protein
MIETVLNEELYRALGSLPYIDGDIGIVHEGERRILDDTGQVVQPGEHYRLNCPFCYDTKRRLWVSYHWGVADAKGNKHWRAIKCFNDDDCYSHWENVERLRDDIYGKFGRDRRLFTVKEGRTEPPITTNEMPHGAIPIDQFPSDHRAVQYLLPRGFDPAYLAHRYGVTFMDAYYAPRPRLTNRLVVPVWFGGQLVGWQARTIYDDVKPKYDTCPSMPKSRLLYNYDAARRYPFVVVVEGVTDAWGIDGPAVATFGADLSQYHAELICSTWRLMVLMYDEPDKLEKAKPMLDRINRTTRTCTVELPAGIDPAVLADVDPAYMWQLIYNAAVSVGVDLAEMTEVYNRGGSMDTWRADLSSFDQWKAGRGKWL